MQIHARQEQGGRPCSRAYALHAGLLPAGVVTAQLIGQGDPAGLLAAERQTLGHAMPKRAREFAAGRLCARAAAAQLGVVNVPIVMREDRCPRWPQGLTGSITHTQAFAAAAVGSRQRFRALGIDAERIDQVSDEMLGHVLRPAEMRWLLRQPAVESTRAAALIFSAKESFYKCQYEVTEQWLEFQDVVLELADDTLKRGWLEVRAAGRISLFEHGYGPAMVHFAFTRELIVTAMAIVEK